MKKLNFAILGCGRVSEYHARIIQKNKYTKLFAVCDKKILKAKKLGNKFKVNFFQNYKDLIKKKIKLMLFQYLQKAVIIIKMLLN